MSEIATLAGGCFWCLEAVFRRLKGVESVVSGYMGGQLEHPTYQQVCQKTTGHAEVAQIRFDPAILSYQSLLDVFFTIHDPTTRNRQGNDIGPQYRSAVFCHSPEQEAAAKAKLAEIAGDYSSPIVTEVTLATRFWPAEDYHQDYFAQNAMQPYCSIVIAPKINKALHDFAPLIKS